MKNEEQIQEECKDFLKKAMQKSAIIVIAFAIISLTAIWAMTKFL